ncbi:hypothetical protein AgCh_024610 [Apium graveolens]
MSSNTNRNWLLIKRDDDYRSLRVIDAKEYFAGVRREWAYRREESDQLRDALLSMGLRVPTRHSIDIYSQAGDSPTWAGFRKKVIRAVTSIRKENNRMLLRRSRQYMYELARDSVCGIGRELTEDEQHRLLRNENYLSDDYIRRKNKGKGNRKRKRREKEGKRKEKKKGKKNRRRKNRRPTGVLGRVKEENCCLSPQQQAFRAASPCSNRHSPQQQAFRGLSLHYC